MFGYENKIPTKYDVWISKKDIVIYITSFHSMVAKPRKLNTMLINSLSAQQIVFKEILL